MLLYLFFLGNETFIIILLQLVKYRLYLKVIRA